jgi:hypothetical protein
MIGENWLEIAETKVGFRPFPFIRASCATLAEHEPPQVGPPMFKYHPPPLRSVSSNTHAMQGITGGE